ncbi:hypothetical protein [Eubacterium aggregans]|uniref:hypothetical protein n=1 Tax=Eubacterium aggregans TaxID=81409 RepID=UPI003F33912E
MEQDDATTENIEQNEAQTEERAESADQIEWEDYFQDGYEPSYAKGVAWPMLTNPALISSGFAMGEWICTPTSSFS